MLNNMKTVMKREQYNAMSFDDYCLLEARVDALQSELAESQAEVARWRGGEVEACCRAR